MPWWTRASEPGEEEQVLGFRFRVLGLGNYRHFWVALFPRNRKPNLIQEAA